MTLDLEELVQKHGRRISGFHKRGYRNRLATYYTIVNCISLGRTNLRDIGPFGYGQLKGRIDELLACHIITKHDVGIPLRLTEKGYQFLYLYEEIAQLCPQYLRV